MSDEDIIKDFRAMRYGRMQRIWRPFMEKYHCDVIAEIGVRKGYNFWKMIKHGPKLAVAVDSWTEDGVRSRNDVASSQESLDGQYQRVVERYGQLPFVKIYREYSFEAVKRFPDNYFDLVYIDGDHSYEGCLRDIKDWYPKVKSGKFLVGDDYRVLTNRQGVKFGVIEAVNEFTKKKKLKFFEFPYAKWGIIKP